MWRSDPKSCLSDLIFGNTMLIVWGFPGGSVVKNSPADVADTGLIPGSGKTLGETNVNPLQYSCLGNPLERGAWRAPVHGVTKEWYTT